MPDAVLAGPWRRDEESARLVADAARAPLRVLASAPEPPDDALLALLNDSDFQRPAVVGHQPWLSALLAWLTVGDPGAAASFRIKKAGVAWLRGEPRSGGMQLRALLPPRQP